MSVKKALRQMLKRILPGVSWQNPVISVVLHTLDPLDYLVRLTRGLQYLPSYSTRVRSNGVTNQFGGRRFLAEGRILANILQRYAAVKSDSKILEIGCGCGRTAHALTEIVGEGNYTGLDIERVSLAASQNNKRLRDKKFQFDFMDVVNAEYNPYGKYKANVFVFPYDNEYFDIIFLVSVFTHMLYSDVSNYIKEIHRMLKPGGICMMSTFLMDLSAENNAILFPYHSGPSYYYDESMPEVTVAYHLDFFEKEFEKHNMKLSCEPLIGSWRKALSIPSSSGFSQDILFFAKF